TWLTRPRPEIDRVGSAWLISKFIDRKPKFVFAPKADADPDAIPFDMLDAEFSHHGNCCTFETLTKRFAISDNSLPKIVEMIHDADLDDARFQRVEAVGIDRVLKGWANRDCLTKKSYVAVLTVSTHSTRFCSADEFSANNSAAKAAGCTVVWNCISLL